MARLISWPAQVILRQQGYLFPWSAVCMACGIGVYFTLRSEPMVPVLILCIVVGLAGIVLVQRYCAVALVPVLVGAMLMAVGFGLAGARAHQVAGPVLDFRYYGAVQGRIVAIDRSASDAVRLTLDRVVLERMAPDDTPLRVRVSLHGQQGFVQPRPGAVVILTGHLSGPGGAVEPGGFDFRRHAWFLRLGAVGYTRNPVLLLEPPGRGQWVFKARMWLSARVQATLPGETGAFAAAIMSGDRSGMGQDTLQSLRATNLAHLLAISGLHMGLVAGFVFAALRLVLLLVPRARHHWPTKKIAAAGALVAAFGYLLLSGGNIATERAFVMAAVALVAVMLDRRALSLRAVAIAALIVLTLRPEALLGPGFQMSFAATTALVAVFEQVSRWQAGRRLPRWYRWTVPLLLSSAVAGAATAPIGMAHFNQAPAFGLLANWVAVPVMGLWVVPLGVVSVLLMPVGLDWIALALMGVGLDWILGVASTIGAWDGAVRHVVAPPSEVLALIALGGVTLCVWQGRGRLVGGVPLIVAVTIWMGVDRPALLVADTGTLVGVMTQDGRALSKARASGFIARTWLENDGGGMVQDQAAALWPVTAQSHVLRAEVGALEVLHASGKRAAAQITQCTKDQIIVASVDITVPGACAIYDRRALRRSGAVAVWLTKDGPVIRTSAQETGDRLWTR